MPLTSTPSQYATTDQLQQIALTPAAAARFDGDAQNAALLAASDLADGYLSGQFTLPLSTWGYSLVRAVCNIAAKILYDQYGFNPNAPIDKLVSDRYAQSIKWLEAVSEEKVSPQFVDASGSSPAAGDFIVSDRAVGFTCRGTSNIVGNDDGECF